MAPLLAALPPGTGHSTAASWTFLDEAPDSSLISPDAIVVVADVDPHSGPEVVEIVDEPAGRVVPLCILPGIPEDCETILGRAITITS